MVKLYKDLLISYFILAFVGGYSLFLLFNSFISGFLPNLIIILWVLFTVIVIKRKALKRFNTALNDANDFCRIESSLNQLFGIYKDKHNKINLVVAIYISNLLTHMGKYEMALNMLFQYDPNVLFKRKAEVIYKHLYHSVLFSCYSRMGKREEALMALDNAREALESPYFPSRQKADYEKTQKINYLIIEGEKENTEELLTLLRDRLNGSSILLSRVSLHFSIANILCKNDRSEEAIEHIRFVKENGGDSVYVKALENNFDLSVNNNDPWQAAPVKQQDYKPLVISVITSVMMVALTLAVGFLTMKTQYVNNFNGSITTSVHTFNKQGEILLWTMNTNGYYESETELELQYGLCSFYLDLNQYEGCEVNLAKVNNNTLVFDLAVDFSKVPDDIDDVLQITHTEEEFVKYQKYSPYTIYKYTDFLGIRIYKGVL